MSDPVSTAATVITAVEYGLWGAGLIVLWRTCFSSATRDRREAPAPLAPWTITPTHFLQMALCVIMGGWSSQLTIGHLSNDILGAAAHDGDLWLLVLGIGLQLGLLGGVAVAMFALPRSIAAPQQPAPPSPPCPHPFLAAVGTFLIALPVLSLLAYAWKTGLQSLGYDTPDQDMVDMFRHADSPGKLLLMTVFATVVAPLTEEVVFRAGLFRYLRTRIPRWIAVTAPAALFALLHTNALAFLPLFALGVVFSLAYERTGRISVTIIAHSLFNLHTILLIMAGASQ